jgi:hypothetical protein
VHWVALQDHGEFLQIHRQWPQHRGGPGAQGCDEGVGQLTVSVPFPLMQGRDARLGEVDRAVGSITKRRE